MKNQENKWLEKPRERDQMIIYWLDGQKVIRNERELICASLDLNSPGSLTFSHFMVIYQNSRNKLL